MTSFYSRRNAPLPAVLRYDLPDDVKSRILASLQDFVDEHHGGMRRLLNDVGEVLYKQYGGLFRPGYEAARRSDDPVIEHFFCCDPDHGLDFIEACFRVFNYSGGQAGVDAVNAILREHGVGYEFTRFIEHHVEKEGTLFGRKRKGTYIEREYPRAIRRDNQLLHAEVTQPALELLAHSALRVANSEILSAHAAFRAGRYEDAITACGSAFESVLKTLCDQKKWAYDKDKDTCSKLVEICHANGLFPSFYVELFKRVGTVRNKLGDAHGRGPVPQHDVEAAHAEHMLHMTCSHIILLCRLAGLH
ncbi:hypothetical protein LBMAG48_10550 [Phycisphaerae bacterium]|nr:hypothetical protein LBMAG48_10550 [Phycisphaerae bacterium]